MFIEMTKIDMDGELAGNECVNFANVVYFNEFRKGPGTLVKLVTGSSQRYDIEYQELLALVNSQ